MSELKQTTKNGQPSGGNPVAKLPMAINTPIKSSDLEDDLEAVQAANKQTTKTNTNTSPEVKPEAKVDKPQGNGQTKQDDLAKVNGQKKGDTKGTPHGQQPDQSKSQPMMKSLLTAKQNSGVQPSYDPYEELRSGKSEEDVIAKLKVENAKLRKELKAISEDLTVMVEKKKMEKKSDKHLPHAKDIIANTVISEKGLQSEIETAQKQLARYQKEVAVVREKFEAQATYDKFQKLQAQLYETETKKQEAIALKKQVEKMLREKEKIVDSLMQQKDHNVEVISMDEETRVFREKLRESEKRKDYLEKTAQKRKEYTQNMTAELNKLKEDFKRVQEKTKFDVKELTPKGKTELPSVGKALSDKDFRIKKVGVAANLVEEELTCTPDNFDKLKKEWKILKKAEELRGKKNERELELLNEQIDNQDRIREDAQVKINEKQKEIAILTNKMKDLSKIVRHQAVVPLLKEEEIAAKELTDSVGNRDSSQTRKTRATSKGKKEPKRPQPYHLLIEYAKHNFQSKGYRKDEKGKVVREDEGVNFNDKDSVGKQRVKIIAIDVWYDEHTISGIQAVYENEKGEIVEGGPHVMNADKSKMITFETLEEDYLKEISGFINKSETAIECLIFRTFRGETMKIGAPTKDSKLFKFDINEMEYPSVLYGSIREDKDNSSKLSRLGVLIATQSVEERIDGVREKKTEDKENKSEKKDGDQDQEQNQEENRNEEIEEEVAASDRDGRSQNKINEPASGGESLRTQKQNK